MSSDEIVWQIIGQQFCAFKIKSVAASSTQPLSLGKALYKDDRLTSIQNQQSSDILP
jgi:hypothetical protein